MNRGYQSQSSTSYSHNGARIIPQPVPPVSLSRTRPLPQDSLTYGERQYFDARYFVQPPTEKTTLFNNVQAPALTPEALRRYQNQIALTYNTTNGYSSPLRLSYNPVVNTTTNGYSSPLRYNTTNRYSSPLRYNTTNGYSSPLRLSYNPVVNNTYTRSGYSSPLRR
ncbi:hypothetical protein D3C87_806340 [compost metagenome]